jgi:hypothetical protein
MIIEEERDIITHNHITMINNIHILTLSVSGSRSNTPHMKRSCLAGLPPWLLNLY